MTILTPKFATNDPSMLLNALQDKTDNHHLSSYTKTVYFSTMGESVTPVDAAKLVRDAELFVTSKQD